MIHYDLIRQLEDLAFDRRDLGDDGDSDLLLEAIEILGGREIRPADLRPLLGDLTGLLIQRREDHDTEGADCVEAALTALRARAAA